MFQASYLTFHFLTIMRDIYLLGQCWREIIKTSNFFYFISFHTPQLEQNIGCRFQDHTWLWAKSSTHSLLRNILIINRHLILLMCFYHSASIHLSFLVMSYTGTHRCSVVKKVICKKSHCCPSACE